MQRGRGMVYVRDGHESWVSNLGGLRRVVLWPPLALLTGLENGWLLAGATRMI